MFNGILTGSGADIQSSSNGVNGAINFTNAITGSKIEIFTLGNVGQIGINGNNLTVTSLQWVDTGVTSLNSVETRCPGAGYVQNPCGLRVDGKILVDSGVTPPSVPSQASTVRANPTSGFSIVTFSQGGSSGETPTVGHGLNDAPEMILMKSRGSTQNWRVYHSALGVNKVIALDTDGAAVTPSSPPVWSVNNSTFGAKNGQIVDPNLTYVAYCFAPVEGYSAFGSYIGNGSTDGPFTFTNFKPRWVLIKNISDSGKNWRIYDTVMNPYNVMDQAISVNNTDAEINTSNLIDSLSNGFKCKGTSSFTNESGKTYIYAALAENPFQANGGLAR